MHPLEIDSSNPLLGSSAPPESAFEVASVPGRLPFLSAQEESALLEELRFRGSEDGLAAQQHVLRLRLFGVVLSPAQTSRLLAPVEASGRAEVLRELYERQLIVEDGGDSLSAALSTGDRMGLSEEEAALLLVHVEAVLSQAMRFVKDREVLPAAPSAPPAPSVVGAPAADGQQAVVVIHSDGRVVAVLGDFQQVSLRDVLAAASAQLDVPAFDPELHVAIVAAPRLGTVGNLDVPLVGLGLMSWARVIWDEAPQASLKASSSRPKLSKPQGRFEQVRSLFFNISSSGAQDGHISKGELRHFLWNLNIGDEDFERAWARMDTRSRGALDIDDLLHLIGRAHKAHPEVPIDALLYEAAVLIVRGSRERPAPSVAANNLNVDAAAAHFDQDLTAEVKGVGVGRALEQHALSFFFSVSIQVAAVVLLILFLVQRNETFGWIALVLYAGYCLHAFCGASLMTSLVNKVEGLAEVNGVMERPRSENPLFKWHIQCYHYETRTRTVTSTDKDGNKTTRHEHYQERVNTHAAWHSGVIPSADFSPEFLPDTSAQMTEIVTHLRLDFSSSNYMACYAAWIAMHRRDIHADQTHSEDLPSRHSSLLAVWLTGAQPWWMNAGMYGLSTLFMCAPCYRLAVQSRLGRQEYEYRKKCYSI